MPKKYKTGLQLSQKEQGDNTFRIITTDNEAVQLPKVPSRSMIPNLKREQMKRMEVGVSISMKVSGLTVNLVPNVVDNL